MLKTLGKIVSTMFTGLAMAVALGFGLEMGKDTYNEIKTKNSNEEEAQ